MKKLLTILDVHDTGDTIVIDWIDDQTFSLIESCYMQENRITFLDTMDVDDLKTLKGGKFWCSTYKDASGGIRIRPQNIISTKRVEQLKEVHKPKNMIRDNPSLAGKIACEAKQKYNVLRKLNEACEYVQKNETLSKKHIPHVLEHIQKLRDLLKKEHWPKKESSKR